ncbi:hypothetical protein BJ138DRAFT_539644 [Hygrophoropsis aurantiaca]|uniref:Uncharacterized protein n=1 Tax=Hygrophoropsis aurantiaca TaxID=72124 RepID=A0ACB8ALP8_9AGAM|nr:hypothetical protein BJ138DRAFT_539644 [Hygrophoropsis aurantiaca]
MGTLRAIYLPCPSDRNIRRCLQGHSPFMATLSMRYLYSPSHAQHHLFPNLLELRWCSQKTTELPFSPFFPPSLRSLALDFYYGDDNDDDDNIAPLLLLLLESECLALTQLHIHGSFRRDNEHIQTLSRALESRSCRHLEPLDCGEIDEPALWHLAQLPIFKNLAVRLPARISAHMACSDWFVGLHTLSLSARNATSINLFLQLAPLSLKRIKINILGAGLSPPSSSTQLPSTLSTRLCHKLLTSIETTPTFPQPRPEATLDTTTLRPPRIFPKPKCLRIDRLCPFELNDDGLTELATAWPLEELILGHTGGWLRTSEITFKGLASLLRACPLLHTLALAIDATQLGSISSTRPEVLNDKIKKLQLTNSTIEKPAAVALILEDFFGSLKAVDAWSMNSQMDRRLHLQYRPLWDEVNSVLQSRKKLLHDSR